MARVRRFKDCALNEIVICMVLSVILIRFLSADKKIVSKLYLIAGKLTIILD